MIPCRIWSINPNATLRPLTPTQPERSVTSKAIALEIATENGNRKDIQAPGDSVAGHKQIHACA